MQYPRYEFVIARDHEQWPIGSRPRPRPEPAQRRTARPLRRREPLRRIVKRREPRPLLATHEYLALEFTVEERR